MCQGHIAGLTVQQYDAKRWAIAVLVLSILNLIGAPLFQTSIKPLSLRSQPNCCVSGWVYLLYASGLAGICGCIASSLLLCCGPTSSSIGESGKYMASFVLAIVTAVIDGIHPL